MKKTIGIICTVLVLVIASALVGLKAVSNTNSIPELEPPILTEIERHELGYEADLEEYIPLSEKEGETIGEFQAENLSAEFAGAPIFAKAVSEMKEDVKVTALWDNGHQRAVNRVDTETAQFEFDENNKLLSYTNLEDIDGEDGRAKLTPSQTDTVQNKEFTEQDCKNLQAELEKALELDGYTLVSDHGNLVNTWLFVWHKLEGEGIVNPLNNVVVTIDSTDGSVSLISRNMMEPNSTEPLIDSKQALKLARNALDIPIIGKIDSELSYVRPNFFHEVENGVFYAPADFIRLAWIINVNDITDIYVDARTGEILGGAGVI